MTTQIIGGPHTWEGSRDAEGHREYKITWLIRGSSTAGAADGPRNVLTTAGLPAIGSTWSFGGDVDPWAWCRPESSMKAYKQEEGEPFRFWTLEQTFSTKPQKRCSDTNIENPLLEPQKLSGGFARDKEEAYQDRYGRPILNSALEQFRGPQVEFDGARPIIRVEQNVSVLNWALVAGMVNTVNFLPLWGFPRRAVRMGNADWERKYYGTCFRYYTRKFEFEMNVTISPSTGLATSGWDRDLLDESTSVLGGANAKWVGDEWQPGLIDGAAPSRFNPKHFVQFVDKKGAHKKGILNGAGLPAGSVTTTTGLYTTIVNNNLGNSLTNSSKWLPVVGDYLNDSLRNWDGSIHYVRGNFTGYQFGPTAGGGFEYYVCIKDNVGENPVFLPAVHWLRLPYAPQSLGTYNAASNYLIGDVVSQVSGSETGVGYLHVEKYNESVFSLLGIPLNLEE